jgi:hypothetical protein
MVSKFTQFLINLSKDPKLLEDYKVNPEDVMKAAKLTPAERALLLCGDAKLIKSAFINDPEHKKAMGVSPDQEIQFSVWTTVHGIVPQKGSSPSSKS